MKVDVRTTRSSNFPWERQPYLHERICTKYNNIIMVCLVRAA